MRLDDYVGGMSEIPSATAINIANVGGISNLINSNGNYKVVINKNANSSSGPVSVECVIPETVATAFASKFSQPFGQLGQDSKINTAAKILSGTSLTSQLMTAQVWEGSDPVDMSLEVVFLAESDPIREVLEPIKQLLGLVLPAGKGGVMTPPGPVWSSDLISQAQDSSLAQQAGVPSAGSVPGTISLTIGNYLYFESVVITNVNVVWHSVIHSSGIPIRADVTIQFITYYIPVVEDLSTIFRR